MSYLKEIKTKFANRKYLLNHEAKTFYSDIRQLQKKYNIPPKLRATKQDYFLMIQMVLVTGNTGTKVIKQYALDTNKPKEWVKDISYSKIGSSFKKALLMHKNTKEIIELKNKNIYDHKNILNQSVTGGLSRLSKQIMFSNLVDELQERIKELEADLSIKSTIPRKEKIEWSIAQELINAGKNARQVAEIMGVSQSGVRKYTKR
ncbi:MAG: hypothetical protein NTY69_03845 [Methylococcales bacterium]|nr:hypothetical protein [Methylococcales bacterium]